MDELSNVIGVNWECGTYYAFLEKNEMLALLEVREQPLGVLTMCALGTHTMLDLRWLARVDKPNLRIDPNHR
jgi:hypothetical protein